jgi:putative peptidoglycan lipid II flippase
MLPPRRSMVVLGTHLSQGEAALEASPRNTEKVPEPNPVSDPGFLGAAWSVAIATMISRILGLLREMVLARYFGAGLFTDAFNVAFRIPNLLRDLFSEGALSSAFIPAFIQHLTHEGKEQAWLLANRVLSALLVFLGFFTLVIFFGAKGFVYLMAAGFASIPEKFALTVQMTQVMSPFLLCIALASVGMGLLNACGSFFVPAMASSAFNICCILAGIFLSPLMPHWGYPPILSMAVGSLIGGISQFVVMMPSAHNIGFRYRFVFDLSDPGLRQIARLMLPAVIGLSAAQINTTVDCQLASVYGNGPVSWLNYGFRLIQFPLGVFGIAIATVTTASVARMAAQNDRHRLQLTLASSLRLAACLSFPATVGLILFRKEIVQLIYERGSFLPSDTLRTGQVLLFYAIGLFSYSAVKIIAPAFYALNDSRTPVRVSLIAVAAKVALNLALILPFGFLGLALATSIASWLNFGMLYRQLPRKTGFQWNKSELGAHVRIALASLAMGVLGLLAFRVAGAIIPGSGILAESVRLGIAIIACLSSLLPLFRLFRVDEEKEILRIISMLASKTP